MQEGGEEPMEEEMGTHSSILAWEVPWTEEPGGLQSMELQRVRHGQAQSTCAYLRAVPCVEEQSRVHTHCRQSKERKISKLNYARSVSCSHLVNHKCSGGNLTLGKHE